MAKYLVIDLEMCRVPKCMKKEYGFRTEIIQIGAVKLNSKYEIEDKFSIYVKPEFGTIDSEIKRLTGISNEDVYDAMYLEDALKEFCKWMGRSKYVAVSWSDSDLVQFQKELAEKEIACKKIENLYEGWFDAQSLFGEKLDTTKQYNLTEALIAADIVEEGRTHDGLSDAYNTAKLFGKMKKEKEFKLNTLYFEAKYVEPTRLTSTIGDLFAGLNLQAFPA